MKGANEMRHSLRLFSVVVLVPLACALGYAQDRAQSKNWTIPATASEEVNPLSPTPDVLKKGRAVYSLRCQRCHGPEGRGDGPDGDPDAPTADLTDGFRVSINPDGVVFYKIWNGRARVWGGVQGKPRMPAFNSVLLKDEAWALVAYVQTLRKPE
jgi:mono/diheme cytochrome c family protein